MAIPTGTVNIVDTNTGTTLATGTLDASGNVTLTWTAVTGIYTLVANYLGDSNFDPGSSPAVPYTVTAVLQNVTVTLNVSPPSPAPAGTSVTFAVGVTPATA